MNIGAPLVQELWNYCNILRGDGLPYGDYLEQLIPRLRGSSLKATAINWRFIIATRAKNFMLLPGLTPAVC